MHLNKQNMQICNAFLLFLGFAAAAPSVALDGRSDGPQSVTVQGVSFAGSGCAAGDASVHIDSTGSLLATFHEYGVKTGPNTVPGDWQKFCRMAINLQFDSGFQFSVVGAEMIGSAQIPAGVNGQCTNTFSVTGGTLPPMHYYSIAFPGPYSGNFDLQAQPGNSSWSPCGASSATLNMNTACSITPVKLAAFIYPRLGDRYGLFAKAALQWQRCPGS